MNENLFRQNGLRDLQRIHSHQKKISFSNTKYNIRVLTSVTLSKSKMGAHGKMTVAIFTDSAGTTGAVDKSKFGAFQ
jgi:hypothetical protein